MEQKETILQQTPEQEQNRVAVIPSVEKREFSAAETVFAWLCFVVGYAYFRVSSAANNPLGAFLLIVALYLVTGIVLHVQKTPIRGVPLVSMVSAIIVSGALLLCADGMFHRVSYTYALATYFYVLYSVHGNTLENGCSSLILIDYLRALFVVPFASLGAVFAATVSGRKHGGKVLAKLLLGGAIAIFPTIVVSVLLSYDRDFTDLAGRIFDWNFREIFSHICSVLFGLLAAMYLFSAYVSSADGKFKDVITVNACRDFSQKARVLSPLTVTAAVAPLLVVYTIFFASQWKYYISGFLGELPEMTVYSQYARDGFFQLCIVSVINFTVLAAMQLFTARKELTVSLWQRVLAVILSVFTLVLIATAIAKMVLYIDCYGLTPKRVQASWFMIVLAVLFLLVIVGQFLRKLKLIPVGISVCVVLYAVLSLSGVDGQIAKYNVDRYLAGTLDTVDVSAMEDLGDAAIPQLVRLVKEWDKRDGTDIAQYRPLPTSSDNRFYGSEGEQEDILYEQVADYLYQTAADWEDSVFSFTIPHAKAKVALREAGILKE